VELLQKRRGLVANMTSYHKLNRFEKKVLSLVADTASESQVMMLRRTFRSMDKSGDGGLSRQELIDGFRQNDVDISQETVEALFSEMDRDGQDRINYNEWLAATIGSKILRSEKAISGAFMSLDSSGTGFLSRKDLEAAVGAAEARRVLDSVECGKQSLTFDDFKVLVTKISQKRMAVISMGGLEEQEAHVDADAGLLKRTGTSIRHKTERRPKEGRPFRASSQSGPAWVT